MSTSGISGHASGGTSNSGDMTGATRGGNDDHNHCHGFIMMESYRRITPGMCICVYVYMYVCVCAYVYICVHVCMYVCVCVVVFMMIILTITITIILFLLPLTTIQMILS